MITFKIAELDDIILLFLTNVESKLIPLKLPIISISSLPVSLMLVEDHLSIFTLCMIKLRQFIKLIFLAFQMRIN